MTFKNIINMSDLLKHGYCFGLQQGVRVRQGSYAGLAPYVAAFIPGSGEPRSHFDWTHGTVIAGSMSKGNMSRSEVAVVTATVICSGVNANCLDAKYIAFICVHGITKNKTINFNFFNIFKCFYCLICYKVLVLQVRSSLG